MLKPSVSMHSISIDVLYARLDNDVSSVRLQVQSDSVDLKALARMSQVLADFSYSSVFVAISLCNFESN